MKSKIPSLVVVQTSQQNNQKQSSNRNKMAVSRSNFKMKFRKIKFRRWSHVDEYCQNSTVHGLRYFAMQNIHSFERIWWIISVLCSMVACCILIAESYKKWNENPVIVTFSEKMTPITMIPFPAVTICPETKSQRSVFNYSDTLNRVKLNEPPLYGLSLKESELVSAQFQICDPEIIVNSHDIGKKFTNDSIFDLIREVAPNKFQSIRSCKFGSLHFYCGPVFQEVMTDDGLCFTFNSLTADALLTDNLNYKIIVAQNVSNFLARWTLEDGYDYDITTKNSAIYPYRALNAGSRAGLEIIMAINEDDIEYACRGPTQGLKVILHSPNELPQVTGQYFRIPVGQDMRVSLKPNILKTTKSLKGYHPDRRQCYFNSERKLRHLKTYSQRNCELECLANYTFARCGCVKFSMPRDSNIPICGLAKVRCYISAADDFLEEAYTTNGTSLKFNKCGCLPACVSISYDTEISQAAYAWAKYFTSLNLTAKEDIAGLQLASLSIFFKENQFITSKRSELFGLTDFVSTCGGLLGLFMGVSLLSIVELVYYFSLRLFCSIRTKRIQNRPKKISTLIGRQHWRTSNQLIRPDPIWSSREWYIGH